MEELGEDIIVPCCNENTRGTNVATFGERRLGGATPDSARVQLTLPFFCVVESPGLFTHAERSGLFAERGDITIPLSSEMACLTGDRRR